MRISESMKGKRSAISGVLRKSCRIYGFTNDVNG